MLVRRVWGNVTAGKVNVEVMTHYRTANAVDVRKKIAAGQGRGPGGVRPEDGRRKEPLREQQVANAVDGQLAVNRQILAQQLAAAVDPAVLAGPGVVAGNAGSAGGDGGTASPLRPRSGAVGYQPVIITLPEGANLMATAVISADRRYVRITSMPFFSGVGQVHTFNMATGQTGRRQAAPAGKASAASSAAAPAAARRHLFRRAVPGRQGRAGALFPYRGQCGGGRRRHRAARFARREGGPLRRATSSTASTANRFRSTIRSSRYGTR